MDSCKAIYYAVCTYIASEAVCYKRQRHDGIMMPSREQEEAGKRGG